MRFSSRYSDLMDCLADVSSVLDDSFIPDDARNVIFKFQLASPSNEVYLIGINRVITLRRRMVSESCTIDLDESEVDGDGVLLISIKAKELTNFLGSYKGLRKTRVEDVILERTDHGKIKCTVVEKNVFSEDELANLMYSEGGEEIVNRTMTSTWVFDSIPIPANLRNNINLVGPKGDLVQLRREYVQLHTQNLLPIMQNGTNLYSTLLFDSESVVGFNQAYTTIMKNRIADGEVFSDVMLTYKAISYIDRLVSSEDVIEVAKTDKHIYIRTLLSETFLIYSTRMALYKNVADLFTRNSVVTVDRIYLKDVLKRLMLINDSIEVNIKPADNVATLSNSKFSQDIDLAYQRGMSQYNSVRFKIMPDVMNKAIIGADDKFINPDASHGSEVYIYYCADSNAIVFSDASDGWYSVVKVKVY